MSIYTNYEKLGKAGKPCILLFGASRIPSVSL